MGPVSERVLPSSFSETPLERAESGSDRKVGLKGPGSALFERKP
jgi:hypothetical protein